MEPVQTILIFGIAQLFMLVGLLGLIIPIYPGLVIMWLSTLGYAIATGWGTLGIILFAIITVLMIFGSLVDNLMMGAGAHRGGASWTTILVAYGAAILGTLLLPPFGGIIAAPLAVLFLEYNRVGDWQKAWIALRGLLTGWGLAYFVRLLVGFIVMGLWWVWAWTIPLQNGS